MVKLVNRAYVATGTTGTGTLTLGGPVSGHRSFEDAGVVDTDVVRYVIEDSNSWEIGEGTYSAGTLTRNLLESSTGSLLILSGSAFVYITAVASDIVQPSSLATVATSGAYSDLSGKPTLAAVATTGSYTDLTNKPVIPSAYTNSDVDTHLNVSSSGTDQVLSWTGSDYAWVTVDIVPPPAAWYGDRGVFAGGTVAYSTYETTMDYITISTTGNATDFGDLTVGRWAGSSGASSGSRGVFAGGLASGYSNSNVIDYITFSTPSNATDFGDLTVAREGPVGCSDVTFGVFAGGAYSDTNIIDYVTIATTGNATDFGDMTIGRGYSGGCSDATRGLFGGGFDSGETYLNTIDYITIATPSNATDFGDLTTTNVAAACSDSTRGLFAMGNTVNYVTIQTTGNATSFGTLTGHGIYLGATSNGTRAVFAGGEGDVNTISYVTIQTTGNGTDFGDLTVGRERPAGTSGG